MANDRNKLIGERVRFHRTAQQMTMGDLCESIGIAITLQQLSNYETNKSRWPADLISEIAEALEVDVRVLLGIEGTDLKTRSPEWWAEKYKSITLKLPEKSRKAVFNMIDGLAGK